MQNVKSIRGAHPRPTEGAAWGSPIKHIGCLIHCGRARSEFNEMTYGDSKASASTTPQGDDRCRR